MKAIVTKFMGPTDTRGARIKATEPDGKSVIVPYGYTSPVKAHAEAAIALAKKMRWTGTLIAGGLKGSEYVFVFSSGDSFKIE